MEEGRDIMIKYKSVIQRYCPSREHNVSVEIARHDDGRVTERCMFSECGQEQCRVCGKKQGHEAPKKPE